MIAGGGSIPNIATKGINQIKKRKILRKELIIITKRFNKFFLKSVQSRVVAISRLPVSRSDKELHLIFYDYRSLFISNYLQCLQIWREIFD